VRVFDGATADRIREWGGIPIVYADAAADDFVRWFERFSSNLTSSPPTPTG
jgi:hypothetical protein